MRPIALIGALVLGSLLMPPPTDAQWDKVPTITVSAPEQEPMRERRESLSCAQSPRLPGATPRR